MTKHPLFCAASQGHASIAKILLDAGSAINSTDKRNYTLHKAVQNFRWEVVDVLLERKADINSKTKLQYTPLLLAADGRQIGIVQALVKHGANVHWKDKFGLTAVHKAYAQCRADPASIIGNSTPIGLNYE